MTPVPGPSDFRRLLQQELLERCRKNPKYSLRAFARSLGVQAPSLSHWLRGRRPLSRAQIARLGEALGLGPAELGRYLDAPSEPAGFSSLSEDAFSVIADWYHFAILELVSLPHFRSEPSWIARALGISVSEANIAIERLARLELLQTRGRKWRTSTAGNSTLAASAGAPFSTVALRRVQKQFLEKALVALDQVPVERRDQTGMTLCVAHADLPEIRSRIKKFRRELTSFVERNKKSDEVYQLVTSIYPLSQTQIQEGARK